MSESHDQHEVYWHENAGARILVPVALSIKQPFPLLYARARSGMRSMSARITSNSTLREFAERVFRQPPRTTLDQNVTIIRSGRLSAPYNGMELLWEIHGPLNAAPCFGIRRLLYLDESLGPFADVHAQGEGFFAEVEPLWRKVMDSFSWDRENAVVFKMDGDERDFVARYAKKKKRRKPLAGPPLPSRVSYLQPFMNELFSLPPEEVNEDVDMSLLDQSLEQRVQGLSLAKAEARLVADRKAMEAWAEKNPNGERVVAFLLPIMHAFEFALGERDGNENGNANGTGPIK